MTEENQSHDDNAKDVQPAATLITMRELTEDTPNVIKKINESGIPALITLRGRFVALVTPLVGVGLEGRLIDEYLARKPFLESDEEPLSTEELGKKLGVDLPDYPNRDVSQ